MTLDFPSRYESVQYPFGFYVLNYTSRMLTAQDTRTGSKVDLQVVPIYNDDVVSLRCVLSEVEIRGKLKHKNLLPWLHLFAYKDEDNRIPSLCFSFPSAPLTLLDMVGLFPVCPWPLTHDKVAWIGYQLLSVLHYLHCCHQVVLHLPLRHIHVSLDGNYDIKVQDFGWKYPCFGNNITEDDIRQCMRFSYKWNGFSVLAPEVLADMSNVDGSADMWNFGCVMAMLLTRASLTEDYPKPILCCPGEDSLEVVGQFLGKAPEEFLSKLKADRKQFFSDASWNKNPLKSILCPEVYDIPPGPLYSSCSAQNANDLLQHLIAYPSHRLSAEDALRHPYFSAYFTEVDVIHNTDNAVDIPEVREALNKLDGRQCVIGLHRSVAFHELKMPLEVYTLQDICIKTIESSQNLAKIRKLAYPKSLLKRIVDQAESLVS